VDAGTEGLETLTETLREQLVREASDDGEGDGQARIAALVEREAAWLSETERAALRRRVTERSLGLGPLEPLLADPAVEEVMVNGPGRVWVERRGRIEPTDVTFTSAAELRHAIERILAPLGRRVDEAQPLVDGRLGDGSRVNVVIPPLALDGPLLTIRRFRRDGIGPDQLVAWGTLDQTLRDFLCACVRARLTILVSGGTGSGKTTTLGALSSFIPDDERIITIEDAAELRLRQSHVVRLEARLASMEGRGEVTIRQLVRNALRMRPDRIVVGEVRDGAALDMLSAMASVPVSQSPRQLPETDPLALASTPVSQTPHTRRPSRLRAGSPRRAGSRLVRTRPPDRGRSRPADRTSARRSHRPQGPTRPAARRSRAASRGHPEACPSGSLRALREDAR
jgi:pilus assembly protein CpaF